MLLVLMIVFLNVFDALATLYGIRQGYAYEVNPLLIGAVSHHPVAFVALKILAPASVGAWASRYYPSSLIVRVAIWITLAAYSLLACWHVFVYLVWRLQ